MRNKIIIPTGYMGSGSSAITNLLSEFDNIDTKNADFEYVFLHCPNGLFDLEDKLLIGNTSIRSDEAVHSFLVMMNELYIKDGHWVNDYKKKLSPYFYNYCQEFIDDLGVYEFDNSYWYYQQIPRDLRMKLLLLCRRIVGKISMGHVSFNRPVSYKKIIMTFPDEEVFYNAAKKFLLKIFIALGYEENTIVLDQLLLPHNVFRIKKYFDKDVRIIVVDRDPRDVFILNKYVWNKTHVAVPYPLDVSLFCKYYSQMRNRENVEKDSRVLRIHFEDLIYCYETTLCKIYDFLEIDVNDHKKKKFSFNPSVSIKNTQLFVDENIPKIAKEESSVILKELNQYTYEFPTINIKRKGLNDLF